MHANRLMPNVYRKKLLAFTHRCQFKKCNEYQHMNKTGSCFRTIMLPASLSRCSAVSAQAGIPACTLIPKRGT